MNMQTIEDWNNILLGQYIHWYHYEVLRVPGGWVITYLQLDCPSSVFVPESKYFSATLEEIPEPRVGGI